jgi:hypothetical protein
MPQNGRRCAAKEVHGQRLEVVDALDQARQLDRCSTPAQELRAQARRRFVAAELEPGADDQAPEPDQVGQAGLLLQRQLLDWTEVRELADLPDPTTSVDPHGLERRDVGTGEVMQQLGDRALPGPRRAAHQHRPPTVRGLLDRFVHRDRCGSMTHEHGRGAAQPGQTDADATRTARAVLPWVLTDSVVRHGWPSCGWD